MQNAKPGNTFADINNAMSKILKKIIQFQIIVGRMGHGIGLQLTEPPSIMVETILLLKKYDYCYRALP